MSCSFPSWRRQTSARGRTEWNAEQEAWVRHYFEHELLPVLSRSVSIRRIPSRDSEQKPQLHHFAPRVDAFGRRGGGRRGAGRHARFRA